MNDLNIEFVADQPGLPGMCPISDAVSRLSLESGRDERGAIFTRREVVDFMLDLAGYTADQDLTALRLLEPSFGGGEFLMAAAERLIASWQARGCRADLDPCIHAVELHRNTFDSTLSALASKLASLGLEAAHVERLTSRWLHLGDFLLAPLPKAFDIAIGNPPYVRQELIPAALLAEYRRRFVTLYDRADLYVPFIERSLDALGSSGQLCFICADRWMKNRYGGPLRAKIANGFHLKAYVDMTGTQAFEAEVSAYPAITLIERGQSGPTLATENPNLEPVELVQLAAALRGSAEAKAFVRKVPPVLDGSEPWLLSSGGKLGIIRRLEATLPTLEEVGCKVGIGVATGADKAFIAPFDSLDVEPSRKLPLVTTRDIASGHVEWKGLGVANPFEDDGRLVDLARYPKLAAHLEAHRPLIAGRHVAQKAPGRWYRTIDRITPSLTYTPKLLIPDIKGAAHVAFEEGRFYPHHNLYFVVSTDWDLRALQAILLSSIAREFICSYSTAMRGGFLRFQAQYLRRIRIPFWRNVDDTLRCELVEAALLRDIPACDKAASKLYNLSDAEIRLLHPT